MGIVGWDIFTPGGVVEGLRKWIKHQFDTENYTLDQQQTRAFY